MSGTSGPNQGSGSGAMLRLDLEPETTTDRCCDECGGVWLYNDPGFSCGIFGPGREQSEIRVEKQFLLGFLKVFSQVFRNVSHRFQNRFQGRPRTGPGWSAHDRGQCSQGSDPSAVMAGWPHSCGNPSKLLTIAANRWPPP